MFSETQCTRIQNNEKSLLWVCRKEKREYLKKETKNFLRKLLWGIGYNLDVPTVLTAAATYYHTAADLYFYNYNMQGCFHDFNCLLNTFFSVHKSITLAMDSKSHITQLTVFPYLMISFSTLMCSLKFGCGLRRR